MNKLIAGIVFAVLASMLKSSAAADDVDARFSLHIVVVSARGLYGPTLRYDLTNVSAQQQRFIWRTYILPQAIIMADGGRVYSDSFNACPSEPTVRDGLAGDLPSPKPVTTLKPGETVSFEDSTSLCKWNFERTGTYEGFGMLMGGPESDRSSAPMVKLTSKWMFSN